MLQYFLLLIITAFLASCVSHGIPPEYMPEKNPRPKYFLTVEGYIAPSLRKTVKVTWVLDYQTTNPKCESEINDFEGVWVSQDKNIKIVSRANTAGEFKNQLPLDYYLLGKCKWKLNNISYNAGDLKDVFVTGIDGKTQALRQTSFDELVCHKPDCELIHGNWFSDYESIPLKNGFTYKLNILFQKGKVYGHS